MPGFHSGCYAIKLRTSTSLPTYNIADCTLTRVKCMCSTFEQTIYIHPFTMSQMHQPHVVWGKGPIFPCRQLPRKKRKRKKKRMTTKSMRRQPVSAGVIWWLTTIPLMTYNFIRIPQVVPSGNLTYIAIENGPCVFEFYKLFWWWFSTGFSMFTRGYSNVLRQFLLKRELCQQSSTLPPKGAPLNSRHACRC